MIKQFKIGVKMLRHAHGSISCVMGAVICFLVGLAMMLSRPVSDMMGDATGAYFIIMVSIWITQMFYSIQVSSMVATSAYAKALQTSIPALLSGVCYFLTYAVVVVIQLFKVNKTPENSGYIALETICVAVLCMIFACYMGAALKYFVVSTICFLIMFMVLAMYLNIGRFLGFTANMSVLTAGLIGFVVVIAGGFAQYGISVLLYKRQMSKYAQMTSLRKTM